MMDRPADQTVVYLPNQDSSKKFKFPPGFPNQASFKILMTCAWKGGPFQCLLDHAGTRYNIVLAFDEADTESEQNKSLRHIHQCLAQDDLGAGRKGAVDCVNLILPFVKSDHERHEVSGGTNRREDAVAMVLLRRADGELCVGEHDRELVYDGEEIAGRPVENTFPQLHVLADSAIERVEKLASHKYKVKIEGGEYFMKKCYSADDESFTRELTTFAKLPPHPNVSTLLGVTDAGDGRIDGIVIGFIRGRMLAEVKAATEKQKAEWKRDIAEAVDFLHRAGVVWGDAAAQNVMIDDVNNCAVLIDFGGRISRGWIDNALYETREGDLQAVGRLHDYIDNLDDNSTAK